MAYNTAPENFTEILTDFCRKYTEEVREKAENGLKEIGRETLAEVKSLSPVYEGKSRKLTKGKYKKSWILSVNQTRGTLKITVHNKQYQLVHLLELGHLLKDGTGRIYGEVQPKKHVEEAEKHAEEKVNALLEGL